MLRFYLCLSPSRRASPLTLDSVPLSFSWPSLVVFHLLSFSTPENQGSTSHGSSLPHPVTSAPSLVFAFASVDDDEWKSNYVNHSYLAHATSTRVVDISQRGGRRFTMISVTSLECSHN